jgi:hypothetical protein
MRLELSRQDPKSLSVRIVKDRHGRAGPDSLAKTIPFFPLFCGSAGPLPRLQTSCGSAGPLPRLQTSCGSAGGPPAPSSRLAGRRGPSV